MASGGPAIPVNVVALTGWTFCKLWKVKWVNDGYGLDVHRLRDDSGGAVAPFKIEILRRLETGSVQWYVCWQGFELFILDKTVCSTDAGHLVQRMNILDDRSFPFELGWQVYLVTLVLFPAFETGFDLRNVSQEPQQ